MTKPVKCDCCGKLVDAILDGDAETNLITLERKRLGKRAVDGHLVIKSLTQMDICLDCNREINDYMAVLRYRAFKSSKDKESKNG